MRRSLSVLSLFTLTSCTENHIGSLVPDTTCPPGSVDTSGDTNSLDTTTDTGTPRRNERPNAPEIAIIPAQPGDADDLTCTVVTPSTDPENDPVTYAYNWQVNGQDVGFTGAVVPAMFSTNGQKWTCTVTPADPGGAGPDASDVVTIQDCAIGDVACPGLSCNDILKRNANAADGTYWIDPNQTGTPYQVACDQTTDGGGWTLVMVTSDDGQTNWSWNNRHLLDTDSHTFGDLAHLHQDFKSPALHDVATTDMLFVHHPSSIWAAYDNVGDGSGAFGDIVAAAGQSTCFDQNVDGFPMSAGTLRLGGNLCSTRMFLNPADWDGYTGCSASNHSDAYGPAWSADNNAGCPFDDPGSVSGVGPNAGNMSAENQPNDGSLGLGFGQSLCLNVGNPGTGQNRLDVWVR